MENNGEIKKAVVEVRKMTEDEKMQRLADLREKAIMDEHAIYAAGIDKGIEQGEKRGKQEEKIKIAKKLLSLNISIKEIMELTELTKEEIEKINNE